MENNLTNDISIADVANHVFMSGANFQRVFHLVTGITIGNYIRNRRLSLSGQDLLNTDSKVIDIAMRYQYDTSESFSKAFTRFHGIPPSVVKNHSDKLKYFSPFIIYIFIQGGFNMSRLIMEIESCSDMAMQRIFRELDMHDVILAMKGFSESAAEKIFKNISKRVADLIREEALKLTDISESDITSAQNKILEKIDELKEKEEIPV
jgi:AraC-like DNA-binding protein